jgi:N-acetylneuraminic acid mutarotase
MRVAQPRRCAMTFSASVAAMLVTGAMGGHAVSSQAPSTAGQPGQTGGRWTPKADMPTPRLAAVAAEVGGSIFVIGGISKSGGNEAATPDTRAVEEYDPIRDAWRKHNPAPVAALGAVSLGKNILVIAKGASYEFDPTSDAWTRRAAMPTERTGFGVVRVGQRVLVVGGMVPDTSRQWGWRNSATVEEYDPKANTWRPRAAMMTPRHQVAVTTVGNRVYVIGGAATHHDDMDRDVDRVEVYDVEADRWSVAPRMPRGLAYFAAFESTGGILTFPGSNPQVALQAYEPGVLRWRLVETPPPTTRWRYAAAMAGGRVYLFGGVPRGGAADALPTTEEYSPQVDAAAPVR